ncbi:MAG: DNA primase DnaG [Candidatus Heimdallarchaeaceae archaeon]
MGAKTDTATTKYEIHANFKVIGIVEKPDIIGALYGQTDGLLSEELDIRELQKTGKIGRIDVKISSKEGITTGEIIIPSSLSRTETAILAATLETVDRVGPCNCEIKLNEITDVRIKKRKAIVNRAAEIIRQWDEKVSPFSASIQREVEESSKKVKESTVIRLTDEKFNAGPGFEKSSKVILVEGRADVINLMKVGIDNTIAVNGTSIPKKLLELIKNKTVTAFLDGDRGADLILKELIQVANVSYVARAPVGKEVEDLTEAEIHEALKNAVPIEKAIFLTGSDKGITVAEFKERTKRKGEPKKRKKRDEHELRPSKTIRRDEQEIHHRHTPQKEQISHPQRSYPQSGRQQRSYPQSGRQQRSYPQSGRQQRSYPQSGRQQHTRRVIRRIRLPEQLEKAVNDIKQQFEAVVFDENYNVVLKSSVKEIFNKLQDIEKAQTMIVDGVVTQRLLEIAHTKGISLIIGARIADISKKPLTVRIINYKQL